LEDETVVWCALLVTNCTFKTARAGQTKKHYLIFLVFLRANLQETATFTAARIHELALV
jgi:hypothetical protein